MPLKGLESISMYDSITTSPQVADAVLPPFQTKRLAFGLLIPLITMQFLMQIFPISSLFG